MSLARVVLAAGLVVIAQVIDAAILARASWPGTTPDLTLAVVVALALLGGKRAGLAAGLAAGLLADLTPPSANLLGLSAVAYGLGGILAGRWHRQGERSMVAPLLAAAGAGLAAGILFGFAAMLRGSRPVQELAEIAVASAGYAVLASIVVIPLVVLLDRLVEGDPAEIVRL